MSIAFMRALVARDLATAEAEIGAIVPADLPDTLDHFLQFRHRRPGGGSGGPAVARPGDRPDRGRRHGPGRSDRSGSTRRPTPTAGSRSAIASSRALAAAGSPPRPSRAVRLGAREHGCPPLPRLDRAGQRRLAGVIAGPRVPPDRASRWTTSTGSSSSSSSTAGRRDLTAGCHRCRPTHERERATAFDTLAVHAGAEPDELTGAVSPPIYQTSTFAQDGVGRPRGGYEYARSQNPTRERLERAVAALEGGTHGIAFASGSAATAAIAELAAPGDEIVVGDDVYGGTFRYLERVRRGAGVERDYVDLAAGPDALWEALTERTRLVWFETPSNPLLKVVDIGAVVGDGRAPRRGGRPPAARRRRQHVRVAGPAAAAELGADIVFHSATKYLAGHSDTILGVAVTSDDAVAERLRFLQNAMGAVPGPLDCFLVLRGLRTLHLRVERHGANAAAVAAFLRGRAGRRGRSPTRASAGWSRSCPAAAARPSAAAERAIAIAEGTRLFTLAESLGGVESLIEVPAAMTHLSVAGSPLEVDPALVRLSVGIEGIDDLIADLRRARRGLSANRLLVEDV